MPERRPDLRIDVIAPSSYNEEGVLKQSCRITMRSPVFEVLGALAYQAGRDHNLGISVANHNERLERGDGYLERIKKDGSAQNHVVFIAGTKTFELPRAVDIARDILRAGKQVVLGGSGVTLADCSVYQSFINEGISFNVGEGENTLDQIVQDAAVRQLKPVYWQRGFVDLRRSPLPLVTGKKEQKGTVTHQAAIGIGEGCPFDCSFCGVVRVRGRKVTAERSREVSACMEWIERIHAQGLPIMITDDNFRMTYAYREGGLKEEMIYLNKKLEREKGKGLHVVTQMDTRKDVVDEVEALAEMGIKNVFFGMETKDPEVLRALRKKQNDPAFYQTLVDKFHRHKIAVGSGLMIGFWPQTPQSIYREMGEFAQLVDMGFPFFVTPVPGTDDYIDAVRQGQLTTWDLNSYTSTRSVRNWFTKMTQEEAEAAYWNSFRILFNQHNLLKQEAPVKLEQFKRIIYARTLTEVGNMINGRPIHFLMDGIPHFLPPSSRVHRPADGFRGFAIDPDDPAFRDRESYDRYKEEYLSRVAWSPQEPIVA